MIDELRVENVALIREATIRPASGMTVLTGETGAGKSALLSSVKLLMGERADAGAVREGADALVVEGRVFVDGADPDGVIVRRRVGADGRGRVSIDGRMASVRELANGVGAAIDLCGQHEHQRLLSQGSHVHLLDAWAQEDIAPALDAYKEALRDARSAAKELDRVRETCRAAAERKDEATFVLGRIDEVNPSAGELEEIEAMLPKAEHAETLIRAAMSARDALVGDSGVTDLMVDAIDEIRSARRFDGELNAFVATLESALIDIEDVAGELRSYRDAIDFDPVQLDEMQGRMAQLRGLMRTYGPSMEDVLARREQAEQIVRAADHGDELLKAAQAARDSAERSLAAAADAVDAARRACAPRFAHAVTQQMALLEMGGAELEVSMERLPRTQWTADGPSRVEFLYRPAQGMLARPLRKIASGGEVSRVMLACKVVLGDADATETLVFDEVDAGVGGATALALANVLAELARTHQVIVVTHLAQVAVKASTHYLVRKSAGDTGDGIPQTTIEPLEGDARVVEIARMLSGDESETSMAHAREMLDRA